MTAYYNEYDAKTAAWLRELIKAGLIAGGEVDGRSIVDVKADDLRGFSQCHFFAGIGGWSYALRLAGWPDDRPVWTGSPPCQPFSNAGKRKAQADTRHLWPVFFNLIRECQPSVIFGEQVEAAIRTGWLDDLQDDLEAQNYATGKIVLPACGVGGYHIRQRIWFVAERVAESDSKRSQGRAGVPERADKCPAGTGGLVNGLVVAETSERGSERNAEKCRTPTQAGRSGELGQLAESDSTGLQQGQRNYQAAGHGHTFAAESSDDRPKPTNAPDSIWGTPDWLFCRDGKWRPVESGAFPLAHGIPERVVRLRGYGNAIVPQVAAQVISAYMELPK